MQGQGKFVATAATTTACGNWPTIRKRERRMETEAGHESQPERHGGIGGGDDIAVAIAEWLNR
ncbi:hypothetical protein AB4Z48_30770 [Cupriavidus sp. 2TAF22]|uniref:hypothetical protein n=1 Tax=unclassified Cupriavidus TaxID=2640874 RepID=UPI003F8F2ABD